MNPTELVVGDVFRLFRASYIQIPFCHPVADNDSEFLKQCSFFDSFFEGLPSFSTPVQSLNLAVGTVLTSDEASVDGETFLNRLDLLIRSSRIFLFGFSHLDWLIRTQRKDASIRSELHQIFDSFDVVCFAGTIVRPKYTNNLWIPAYKVRTDSIVFVPIDEYSYHMSIACTRLDYIRTTDLF
ncbi:MAG: hypothetical protein RIQ54_635 [Candidatus Parcubacteria bacterium]|jgi:hypothetical protein